MIEISSINMGVSNDNLFKAYENKENQREKWLVSRDTNLNSEEEWINEIIKEGQIQNASSTKSFID